jgi:hypothetical protein
MEDDNYIFTYPIDRLLAKPSIFSYIEDRSGVPYEYLTDAFYTLFELVLEELDENDEEPELVRFTADSSGFLYEFNTGQMLQMEKSPEGIFRSQAEIDASFEINTHLMDKLRDVVPDDWVDDFALSSIPSPKNNFLTDLDNDCFRGQIQRLSNPDEKLSFVLQYLGEDEFDIKII